MTARAGAEERTGPLVVRGSAGLRAAVGAALGPTDWLRVDQSRIDAFAEVTGDHQWIHVDPERARGSALGSTIAHGYLTLSLCSYFLPQLIAVQDVGMGINYGADRVRFPAPVPVGSRIRARGEVSACHDVPGGVQTTILVTTEVAGTDKPACVVETLSRWLD